MAIYGSRVGSILPRSEYSKRNAGLFCDASHVDRMARRKAGSKYEQFPGLSGSAGRLVWRGLRICASVLACRVLAMVPAQPLTDTGSLNRESRLCGLRHTPPGCDLDRNQVVTRITSARLASAWFGVYNGNRRLNGDIENSGSALNHWKAVNDDRLCGRCDGFGCEC